MGWRIETRKDALTDHRTVAEELAPAEGEAIAAIDLVAVTANNVTYAVHHGPPLHYGAFFPASDPERVVVPLWGFATIAASRAEGVKEGDRFYGYWPSASQLRLAPGPAGPRGFDDRAPHRQPMAGVYNQYVAAGMMAASADEEAFAALFRPLFGTAFALDEALGAAPAADTVILTSASSKTALGTSWCLKRRGTVRVVGLTSPANARFVEGTGCYDAVVSYDEVEALDAAAPAVLVDFSGNGALKARLHRHLSGLVASHIVGDTHWAAPAEAELPGPAPALFFAPTSIAAMVKRMGPAGFQEALAGAMAEFGRDCACWLRVETHAGAEGFGRAFDPLVAGRADPAVGAIWTPSEAQ
jgi:hypothetical protein